MGKIRLIFNVVNKIGNASSRQIAAINLRTKYVDVGSHAEVFQNISQSPRAGIWHKMHILNGVVSVEENLATGFGIDKRLGLGLK